MSDYESREDAKQERWEEKHGHMVDQECPSCHQPEFSRTYYDAGSSGDNPEPSSESWGCSNCGYAEG